MKGSSSEKGQIPAIQSGFEPRPAAPPPPHRQHLEGAELVDLVRGPWGPELLLLPCWKVAPGPRPCSEARAPTH